MTTREEVLKFALSFSDTYADTPFHDPNWVLVRYRKNKHAFVFCYEHEGRMRVNLKVDPEWRDVWRGAFTAVLPAYHMNKTYWNTVVLDGSVPEAEVKRMIAESYDLICAAK